FKFFFPRSLRIRALGEPEDVARVDTSLPCFSSVSRLLSAGGGAVAAPPRTALATFSSLTAKAAALLGFGFLLGSKLRRNRGTPRAGFAALTTFTAFSSRTSAAALRENGSGSIRLPGCFFAELLSLCCENWLMQCCTCHGQSSQP